MSKEFYVNNLNVNDEIADCFMVKGASIKVGANHKTYFDVTLCDRGGDINGTKWDVDETEGANLSKLSDGDFVWVKATVSEWNGIKQLRIIKVKRIDSSSEGLDMQDYIKAAPEPSDSMYAFILDKAQDIKDEGLKKVCTDALEENKDRLMYYPGAMRNHHAEYGGLLYHTKRMLDMGLRACSVYTDLDPDWVICGVIMHDMEKLNEIEANELGISSGYTVKGNLLGHIVLGTIRMEERAKKAGLSEEKTVMLQHMILAHHYEPEYGSPVRPMFPEAELLHYLDMLDAKMFDFEAALEGVDGGHFSERVRTLDNRMLYKPSFRKDK